MLTAIENAEKAFSIGEIPVGAVIVKDNKIIATGYNKRENENNALLHAEIVAIENACKSLGDWRLDGCEMYVTLEPCMMCMGAIIGARIETLVFGAYDLEKGCVDSAMDPKKLLKLNKPEIFGGIFEDRCKEILDKFFNKVRK